MKDALQAVCRELDIHDISEIQLCLSKLKAVVKTVPRMERFIAQVCGFLFQKEEQLHQGKQLQLAMDDVPRILSRHVTNSSLLQFIFVRIFANF